jgi:hypothetical protein
VVPPSDWRPPCAIDRKAFRFKTRIQSVHELQLRAGCKAESEAFARSYQAWAQAKGRPPRRNPVLVMRRGGYNKATEDRAWRDVCRIMQARRPAAAPPAPGALPGAHLRGPTRAQFTDRNGAASTLRQAYLKHLLAYEEHCAGPRGASAALAAPPAPGAQRRDAGQARFDAMLAAADDAAEAAEILGALMGGARGAAGAEPPRKRAKTGDASPVRAAACLRGASRLALARPQRLEAARRARRPRRPQMARTGSACRTTSSSCSASCAAAGTTRTRSSCATTATAGATSSA